MLYGYKTIVFFKLNPKGAKKVQLNAGTQCASNTGLLTPKKKKYLIKQGVW